ncbi:MAG: ABC transporter permease [Lachnospiraceae bacterium]|nr:ABC transporter permease [Lachnospiraceae bacterium]
MFNPLNKRIPREFKANAGRYISTFILLFITIIVGAGALVVMDSIKLMLDDMEEANILEDGYWETKYETSKDAVKKIEKRGITVCENFYVTDDDFDGNAKFYVFNERTDIDLPIAYDGRLPESGSDDEIALDRLFAEGRNISIGDIIDVNGKELKVVGTVALPDYTALFLDNQDMMMNTKDFGVSIVSAEAFEDLDGQNLTYRYSYRFNERDKTDKEKSDEAEEMIKILTKSGADVQEFLTEDANQSISYLKGDMGHDGPMIKVFVYILVTIISFIFAVLTANTIEQESSIIGTLMAMGYMKSEVIFHYLLPTIIIALLGSAAGNGFGYTVMTDAFKTVYYGSYSLPPMKPVFNIEAFILTTVIPVVIMIAVNYIMLADKLSLSPLKFLRKDLKKKHQKKAVKLPAFSFLTRFRIRVMLQNKGSFIVLFLGIFFSSFLLMFGIGLNPLMDHYVEVADDTLPYEYMYMLKKPVNKHGGEKLYMTTLVSEYYLTGKEVDVTFYGVDTGKTDSKFKDSGAPDSGSEIAITDSMAKKFKVGVGDTLRFRDKNTDEEYELTVVAVNGYTNNLGAYMDRDKLNRLLDNKHGEYNAYVSDEKMNLDEDDIAKFIKRSDVVGSAKQMMQTFGAIIMAFNVFSVFAYIVIMYLLTKVVIDKNALYISFMKVFGYDSREIRKLYLDASAIVTVVSLIVCIPLEVKTFKVAMVYFSSMIEGYMEFYLPPIVYVKIVAMGLICYFLINAMHLIRIKRIPMSEALKNRD